jgi:hypothetical protein
MTLCKLINNHEAKVVPVYFDSKRGKIKIRMPASS